MKKIIGVGILVVLLMGCNIVIGDDLQDTVNLSKITKSELIYNKEWEELRSVWDIVYWIDRNIHYVSDGEYDIWSPAWETLERGYGDCEDYCILFMNIYYVVFEEKCDLIAVNAINRALVNGGFVNHAEILFEDGTVLDPTNIKWYENRTVGYLYDFDLFFY